MNSRATVWKTIRLLGVSLALVVLVVFATGVVSDWNHQGPSDDANCPVLPPGPSDPGAVRRRAVGVIAEADRFLPLPEDIVLATGPVFSQTAPRAPPAA